MMETKNLGDFLFIYEQFARSEGKSPQTNSATKLAIGKFDAFLGGGTNPSLVTSTDLRHYILHLQTRPKWSEHPTIHIKESNLSPFSIASYVRHIRAFWSWLYAEGFITANPLQHVKPPKTITKQTPVLTSDDVALLLKAIPRNHYAGHRDFTILLTLYGTGLRISELLNLRQHHINFQTGQILVLGKGNRERSVFMGATVYKAMLKYLHKWRPDTTSDYFFSGTNNKPPTRYTIAHHMQNYCRISGLNTTVRCSPHDLRHAFAVQFLRNGGDTFVLQKILGHSTLEMTRHYVNLASSDVEVQLKAYSPADTINVKV